MQILLIEPFFSGSHRQWAIGYQKFSRHQIRILSLPGRHWKWRMYGGAVSLAREFLRSGDPPDLILASDMLDLPTFLGLTGNKSRDIPAAVYFHENQITYPWSPKDEDLKLNRNNQYGFINYTSALAADRIFFNSAYHRDSFLGSLLPFLGQFPDFREQDLIDEVQAKSYLLPLGIDLEALNLSSAHQKPSEPVILWNHRWEYDKSPELFFQTLQSISEQGHAFKLIVLGEAFSHSPYIFEEARSSFAQQILHFGYAPDRTSYAQWLHLADIIPVTSRQDFFGGSVVEAIYCQCYPLLPNRLAYPEHIPEKYHRQHLYYSPEELLTRLTALFPLLPQIRNNTYYRDFVAHYDWRILAADYDLQMEEMIK